MYLVRRVKHVQDSPLRERVFIWSHSKPHPARIDVPYLEPTEPVIMDNGLTSNIGPSQSTIKLINQSDWWCAQADPSRDNKENKGPRNWVDGSKDNRSQESLGPEAIAFAGSPRLAESLSIPSLSDDDDDNFSFIEQMWPNAPIEIDLNTKTKKKKQKNRVTCRKASAQSCRSGGPVEAAGDDFGEEDFEIISDEDLEKLKDEAKAERTKKKHRGKGFRKLLPSKLANLPGKGTKKVLKIAQSGFKAKRTRECEECEACKGGPRGP